MARRTIAERAAAGEIQSIEGLSRVEQGELLVWARQQGIEYSEIIRRYGFTQTSEGLRTWHRNIILDRPERVPRITDTDDELLLRGVELYATGSLDEPKSLNGIWFKVREYIWANGGTTKAGPIALKNRWYSLRGQPVPRKAPRSAKRKPAKGGKATTTTQAASTGSSIPPTRATLARSFPMPTVPTGENQPSSSAQPSPAQAGANTTGNGSAGSGAHPDLTWGEYPDLTADEKKKALGSDYSDQQQEEKEDDEKHEEEGDGVEDDGWGYYSPLSSDGKRKALADGSSEQEEDGAEDDDDDDDDDDEGKEARGYRSRKG